MVRQPSSCGEIAIRPINFTVKMKRGIGVIEIQSSRSASRE
jgi:hypothetical protein